MEKEKKYTTDLRSKTPTRAVKQSFFEQLVQLWLALVPFFASSALFLSVIFLWLAPAPLMVLSFQRRSRELALAVVLNCALVYFLGGAFQLCGFLVFCCLFSFFISNGLKKRLSFDQIVLRVLVFTLGLSFLFIAAYSYFKHLNPIAEFEDRVSLFLNFWNERFPNQAKLTESDELLLTKDKLIWEIPANCLSLLILYTWLHFELALRVLAGLKTLSSKLTQNKPEPGGSLPVGQPLFHQWKIAEFWVWPSILVGFGLVFGKDMIAGVSLIFFRGFMTLYLLQGLSILTHFLLSWVPQKLARVGIYVLALLFLTPLILGLGFFDLWFDFREKVKDK